MNDIAKIERKYHATTFGINLLLLISHMGLFGLFLYLHVTVMVIVNVFSIVVYLYLFSYYKKNLMRYIFVTYMEVLIHMSLATICVGWDSGFQLYCYCLVPCIFLCDYLGKTDNRKTIYPAAVSIVTMLVYLCTRLFCSQYRAIYHSLGKQQSFQLYMYNTVITFVFLIIYLMLFERKILRKERQLSNMAEIDELTKLPNRYLMRDWMHEGFDAATDHGIPMSIAILDIDNFKNINDTYGHDFGDKVLKQLAQDIGEVASKTLHVCRWGGEEFVFLSTGSKSYEVLYQRLEEIRKKTQKHIYSYEDQEVHITVTTGIADYVDVDRNFHQVLKRADDRLYEGKIHGKNQIVGK